MSRYLTAPPATWPLSIAADMPAGAVEDLRRRIDATDAAAQYGWGHTIDFGPFRQDGFLGRLYLGIVGAVDALRWWPLDLTGKRIADVGAFSGGVSAILAARGAAVVYAIDEIPEHVEQSGLVAEAFDLGQIEPVVASLYELEGKVPAGSLDVVFVGGVLYHLSDMLAGLIRLRELLKPDGVLILETNAVECFDHSYANFGRFSAGIWWQPSALCVLDLLRFAGYADPDLVFYRSGRAIARARRGNDPAFTRGLTIPFESLRDSVARLPDERLMAPAPDSHAKAGRLGRLAFRGLERALDLPFRAAGRLRRRSQ